MTKRLVKLCISLVVWAVDGVWCALRCMLKRPAPPLGVILYYHAVKPQLRSRFARQMDMVKRRTKPLRADETPPATGPHLHAAVSFDDGLVSVIEYAVPEMVKRGIPFTIFVPTGCLGRRPVWIRSPSHPNYDERVVSEDELRALASEPLVSVGSHSVTHPDLSIIPTSAVAEELAQSKEVLERLLGREVIGFSFPHGAHTPAVVSQAYNAGYRVLFSIAPSVVTSRTSGAMRGRILADPADWEVEFLLKLCGAYRWLMLVRPVNGWFRNGKPSRLEELERS